MGDRIDRPAAPRAGRILFDARRKARSRHRRAVLLAMAVLSLLTSVVVGASTPLTAHAAGSSVGSFEIDGNLVDSPPGEPIDWSTPPPNLTNFTDASGRTDDSFNTGSKETVPSQWACQTGSAPQKDDITAGQISFRTVNGKQFVYVDWTRKGVNGDAHIDYEFNQSATPNPACPALPQRTNGDIIISFDTNNGGASITVSAYKWVFDLNSTSTGTFIPLSVGSQGSTWDGAVNIPNTIPNHTAGDFGEAVLDLSDTIGTVTCGQFSSVDMKTRSSTGISSALQDRTTTKPVNLGSCPSSSLKKEVRDTNAPNGGTFAQTATAKPGDILEYRLTYTNAGPGDATNVVVSDNIQARQTWQSCNPTCQTDGPPVANVSWTFATVTSGGSQVVTFQVKLDGTFPSGGTTVSNVGVVDTKEEPPKSSNPTTVTVNAAALITSVKTVTPTVAKVGDTVTYKITLTNNGDADGTTTVTDDYDQAHVTIGPATPPVTSNDGDKLTWANVAVPAHGQTIITYTATVKGTFSGGQGTCSTGQYPVINTVTLSFGTGTTATLCVTAAAHITSSKLVNPSTAAIGQTVTYTITVSNDGDASGQTTVTDDYDQAHLQILTTPAPTPTNNGDTLVWSNITVPAKGSVTLTYTAKVIGTFDSGEGTEGCTTGQFPVDNTVTLTVGTGASETLCVTASPTITSQKMVNPTTASVGDTVTYTITLTNSGTATGTTTVTDNYDQNHLQILTTSPTATNNGDTLVWSSVSVSTKKPTVLTYTAKIIGTFSSGEHTGGCGEGQYPVVNTVTLTVGTGTNATLCVNAAPIITSTKSVSPTTANVGDTVTYTIKLSNSGTATGITTVTDDYDQNHLQILTTNPTATNNGNTLVWSAVTVPVGSNTVTLTYTAKVIGTFSSGANTGGCTGGTFPVVNTVTLTVGTGTNKTLCVIATPNITSSKSVTPNPATVGQTVTYTITLDNTKGTADGITTVTDNYDQNHLQITSSNPVATNNGDTLVWSNITVPAGQTVTLTYTAKVIGVYNSGANTGGCTNGTFPVANTVTLTVGTGTNKTLCVIATPNITSSKSVTPGSANIGDTVTYTITLTNTGSAGAMTTVTDDYDQAHLTIGTVAPTPTTNDGDKLVWANVVVPAGGSPVLLTYQATVKGTFSGSNGTCGPNQFPVINSVTLTVGTGSTTTLCVNGPILHISKSACPTPNAVPGGVLTYTIAYSNSGSAAATGTTITDTLPAGESFVAASNGGAYDPNTNKVTWNIGTVAANGAGSVTLQVLVTANNGDSLTNTATISAANASAVTSTPVTSPVSNAGAITHGSAYGVNAAALSIPLIKFGEIDTVAPGSPQSAASNLLTVPLDPLVNIQAVTQLSNSSVNSEATSTSSSTVAGVNLLNGLITADIVKGVAESDASALSASSNSNGSTFANLKVNGNSIVNVAPNTHIDVKDPLTGLITIASLTLEEESKTANLTNGFFTTSESINMIHVVLLQPLGLLPAGADIVVAHANTDATYPSGVACGTTPAMVSGEAFTTSAVGTLNGINLLTAKVGDAAIPPFGGSDSDGPAVVTTAPVLAAAATNTTSGSTTPLPNSTARSVVTGANVLSGLVTADVLDVQSNSTTTATTASSAVNTTITNLKILGLPVNVTITPNTVIAVALPDGSLLVVTIDERIFGGDGVNNTEATVNALHVQVFLANGLLTADVIVASAHSDAHRAHAS